MIPILVRKHMNDGNPGDTFIFLGLQYVLEHASRADHLPWLLLNKFNKKDFEDHVGLIREAGYLIIGGTPQYNNYGDWKFWYDDELWTLVRRAGVKGIPMAGGSGYPSTTMTPQEFTRHCLSDAGTKTNLLIRKKLSHFFTTRDPHAQALMEAVEADSTLLPCSALFSMLGRPYRPSGRLAVVLPSAASVPGGYVKEGDNVVSLFSRCAKALAEETGLEVIFVCHHEKNYREARSQNLQNVFFTNHYSKLLDFYETCEVVVSGRLHGALPAFGLCGPRVVHVSIDTRGSAVNLFDKWMPNIRIQDLTPERLVESCGKSKSLERSEMDSLFQRQVEFYRAKFEQCGINLRQGWKQ